jgi:hypothetical protein
LAVLVAGYRQSSLIANHTVPFLLFGILLNDLSVPGQATTAAEGIFGETDLKVSAFKLPAFLSAILVALLGLAVALLWPNGSTGSRDIGCAKVPQGRGNDICHALSASMEWTWLGHAIVSPGWRVTWTGLGRVYCQEKITAVDLPMLEALKRGPDWRLQDGADGLVHLISGRRGDTEPENSIFNPENPGYILKNGCDQLK